MSESLTPMDSFPPADSAGSATGLSSIDDEAVERELAGITDAQMAAMTAAPAPSDSVPARGTELKGRIAALSGDQLFVEIGLRSQAVLSVVDYGNGSAPEVGAEVDVVAGTFNESSGLLRVYPKGAVAAADLETLMKGSLLEGRVSGMIKGGLEVKFGTILGFMPASQVDTRPIKDISTLLGEKVRCEVLEIDKRHKKIIVSRRNVLEREEAESKKKLLEELQAGQVRRGVVTGLAEFGAFVDLGGLRGLLHISDMKWTPVEKPEDVVKVGDEIEVKVLKVSKARERISLGLKQVTPDPWSKVETDFPVGMQLKVRVVKLAEYGAFAEVAEGVNGLIPMSELSWTHRPAKADELVEVGKLVDVVVISTDAERRRIGLSMKQVAEDPWAGIGDAYPVNSVVTGKVTKLLEFGALVELSGGIEGLVHISEMAAQHVKTPGDVVKVGDEVQVKVKAVEPKKRRISLSIKAAAAPVETPVSATPAHAPVVVPAAPKKERKKPLRGGLASHFQW